MLREFDVAIGLGDEVTHEVIHIRADVAGFAEFRRIRFHKGHADEIRDVFDKVGLSNPGGADDDDILFGEFELGAAGV